MNSYVIKTLDIRCREKIEIDEDRYNELKKSERLITVAAQIEEKIDLLLDNYLDFQKEVLSLSLSNNIRSSLNDAHVEHAIPNLNRKLVNILTAAKLYVDQTCCDLSSGYGKESEIFKQWNQYRQEQHKDSPSYQFMEVLRNYVQHRALPINIAGFRQATDKRKTPYHVGRTVIVSSYVHNLIEFKDFKKKSDLIEKLQTVDKFKPNAIVLGYHISEYVDCLCRVHDMFRTLTDESIRECEATMESARTLGIKKFGSGKHNGLIAVHSNRPFEYEVSRIRLNGRRMERRQLLNQRNICDGTLSTSYVHSMNRPDDT